MKETKDVRFSLTIRALLAIELFQRINHLVCLLLAFVAISTSDFQIVLCFSSIVTWKLGQCLLEIYNFDSP